MKKRKTFHHESYFGGSVTLTIQPFEEGSYTHIEAIVRSNPEPINYTWWLDIPFYIEDIDQAFKEIQKEKYIDEGYTEVI